MEIILCVLLMILIVISAYVYFHHSNTIAGSFERITPLTDYKKDIRDMNILGTFTKRSTKKKSTETLAQRLTKAGWKLYTKESCPWCHLQVDMFGADKQYLNIVDCSNLQPPASRNPANLDVANCNQIWVYPSWVNGNKLLPGSQSFVTLNDALSGKFYTTDNKKTYKKTAK